MMKNLAGLVFGNEFLDTIPKEWFKKEKNQIKLDFLRAKCCILWKALWWEWNDVPWLKIFSNKCIKDFYPKHTTILKIQQWKENN